MVAAVGLAVSLLRPSGGVRTRDEWPVMGTVAGLTFRGEAPQRDAIRRQVQARYERLEILLSAWNPDSELSRLSREGGTNWIGRVSHEVEDCYRMALSLADRSGRAFNPWIGAKLREQGFSHGHSFADFDLGAIAKGFAVDAAWQDVMRTCGRSDLLIDLGGNLRVVGGTWRTGVRNPFGPGYAAVIALTNGEAIATSGNYERFVEKNGVRYGICSFGQNSYTLKHTDTASVTRIVTALRPQCDILVVNFHGGAEGTKYSHLPNGPETYLGENRGNLRVFAHHCIDLGADIVFGHGPHVVRAVECYNGHLIAYSLGNFCTTYGINVAGLTGYAPVLVARIGRDGRFVEGRIHSFIQTPGMGPLPDTENKVARHMRDLSYADFPGGCGLTIADDGTLTPKL